MINRSRPRFSFAAVALVAVVSVLVVPSAASASTPVAQAMYAYSSGPTTVVVVGSVNPEGEDTQLQISYGPASSDWCTSGGASGSPADTYFSHVPFIDSSTYTFYVHLPTDLINGIEYCAHFIATNSSGMVDGGQVSWTQGLPSTLTLTVASTGNSTATVEGAVDPAGQSTSYVVKYDLGSSVWCSSAGASGTPADATAPQILPNTDGTFDGIPVDLTGLTPGASYCAEIVATNSTGTTPIDDGKQVTWTQPTPPPTPVPAACIVPKVTGKPLSAAKGAIKRHHCSVGKITKVESTNKNRGHVVSQTPKPGKHLRKGANVALKVGK